MLTLSLIEQARTIVSKDYFHYHLTMLVLNTFIAAISTSSRQARIVLKAWVQGTIRTLITQGIITIVSMYFLPPFSRLRLTKVYNRKFSKP